jgi:hypothetical protein
MRFVEIKLRDNHRIEKDSFRAFLVSKPEPKVKHIKVSWSYLVDSLLDDYVEQVVGLIKENQAVLCFDLDWNWIEAFRTELNFDVSFLEPASLVKDFRKKLQVHGLVLYTTKESNSVIVKH